MRLLASYSAEKLYQESSDCQESSDGDRSSAMLGCGKRFENCQSIQADTESSVGDRRRAMMEFRRWLSRKSTPCRVSGIILGLSLCGCRSGDVHDNSMALQEIEAVAAHEDFPADSRNSSARSFEQDISISRSTIDILKTIPNEILSRRPEVEPPFEADEFEASSIHHARHTVDAPVEPPFEADEFEASSIHHARDTVDIPVKQGTKHQLAATSVMKNPLSDNKDAKKSVHRDASPGGDLQSLESLLK